MKPKLEVCYQVSNVDPCQKTLCEYVSFYEDYVLLLQQGKSPSGEDEMREVKRIAVADIVYICTYQG